MDVTGTWLALHFLSFIVYVVMAMSCFILFSTSLEIDHLQSVWKLCIASFSSFAAMFHFQIYQKLRRLEHKMEDSINGSSRSNVSQKNLLLALSMLVCASTMAGDVFVAANAYWPIFKNHGLIFVSSCVGLLLTSAVLVADVQQRIKMHRKSQTIEYLGQALIASDDDEGQVYIE